MELTYATGNKGKLFQAQQVLDGLAVVKGVPLSFAEPRSEDLSVVALAKIEQAKAVLPPPFFVNDSAFIIDALHGFPATYVNFALSTIGIEGILRLMDGVENRACHFEQCLAYYDGTKTHLFFSRCGGTLTAALDGEERPEQWSGLWRIFIPEGYDRTLSRLTKQELAVSGGDTVLLQLKRFLQVEE